eukprot:Nitzschia sp. Nitz4//scaffold36_size144017//37676//38815//NITZ4_003074-RA/size144017-processed-gene-0.35-mRNA-1//1//CDS//3329549420//8035//frame0
MSRSLPVAADDTAYRIRPQEPLQEDELPHLDPCHTNQTVWYFPHDAHEPVEGVVDIIRAQDPSQAYRIITSREKKDLDHHAPGWGHVAFGIILHRRPDGLYQEPSPDTVEWVAIKQLNRAVVLQSLEQGKRENPFKEIYRMQTIGDNIHVLSCIEALYDDTFMYIIMPYCEEESLVEWIPWSRGMAEPNARQRFQEILENLAYLRHHGICHRDLSPDNCMIYRGRVVFTDLAMSVRVPPGTNLLTPLGGFGKPAYLPPEVFHNLPFDPFGCDLWSSVVILFNLLTGEVLYRMPHPSDLGFRYFILARGISRTPMNERTVEVLMDLEESERTALWRIVAHCLNLSPEVTDILDGVLRVAMDERWTMEEVASSTWVNAQTL